MTKTMLSIEEAEALISTALVASDVAPANAASVSRALVKAEVDGQIGHGLSRVVAYAAQAKTGKVDGHATPLVGRPRPAYVAVNAANGFAFPAIDLAIDELRNAADEFGVAAAGITRSHHCGQLGAHVERLAETGVVALMVANSPKAMAPWGGRSPLFGTNPIAFAAPRGGGEPLVIDLSLSRVARGKVMAAAQAGQAIPEGWALDAEGAPTTDAAAALKGAMLPAGGAKGSALALMVEILVGAFVGANFSYEASSFFDADGDPPGVGQFMLAISPGSAFGARLEGLASAIEAQPDARLPGSGRLVKRSAAKSFGLSVDDGVIQSIRDLSKA